MRFSLASHRRGQVARVLRPRHCMHHCRPRETVLAGEVLVYPAAKIAAANSPCRWNLEGSTSAHPSIALAKRFPGEVRSEGVSGPGFSPRSANSADATVGPNGSR
jgi:hypothetical protein